MWNSAAELHAALNDLPPALLVVSLAFDLAGRWTKRESLRAAGFWTLMAGGAGAVLALISGLRAEGVIEHGAVVHRTIERHETLAIGVTLLVVGLAAWRIWRRAGLPPREETAYLVTTGLATVGVIWTASVGGNIMFDHAGGIETRILESALTERAAGHAHAPGEADDAHVEASSVHTDSDESDHMDPPGTPPHEHE